MKRLDLFRLCIFSHTTYSIIPKYCHISRCMKRRSRTPPRTRKDDKSYAERSRTFWRTTGTLQIWQRNIERIIAKNLSDWSGYRWCDRLRMSSSKKLQQSSPQQAQMTSLSRTIDTTKKKPNLFYSIYFFFGLLATIVFVGKRMELWREWGWDFGATWSGDGRAQEDRLARIVVDFEVFGHEHEGLRERLDLEI